MAAAAVQVLCESTHGNDDVKPAIPKWRTGLDNISIVWERRCASSCKRRDLAFETSTPLEKCLPSPTLDNYNNVVYFLASTNEPIIHSCIIEPPPPYNQSIADEPPRYDPADDVAAVRPGFEKQDHPPAYEYIPRKVTCGKPSKTMPGVDFEDTSSFRQVPSKKAKKAQKQADQAKWAGGGEEGNNDAGEGEQNGGDGGGSNNGDGGAGDGGGGGDDWNDWDTGNKKKKGKKAKEEEKKKQEEEEKKKQEEEAANATNPLSWADEANGDLGDDWGGFSTGNKKDKKGKKGKTDATPENTNGTSNFDNIDLNDDAPQLDLDFGSNEKKTSGFGFGGWGGTTSWDTGNSWSFGNDAGTTDIADSFAKATTTDTGDSGTWSFGGNKKNKKKTTGGFDFGNFGALNEDKEEAKAEEAQVGGDDDWSAGFTTTNKKGKKDKKKGLLGDSSIEPDSGAIGTAIAEPEPAADDAWGTGWGVTTAKNKKKGKKGEEETPPAPPPAPAAPAESGLDDWGGFGSKKDKKKGKKITEVEEPAAAVVPDPEPDIDLGWSSFGKKDKKKGGKKEAEKIEEPAIVAVPDPEPELDFGWGTSKTGKKKGNKKDVEKVEEPEITSVPEPEPDPGLDFGWGTAKKDKKKGKKDEKLDDLITPAVLEPEPEPEADTGWGIFGSKSKKKGNKKDADKVEDAMVTKEPDPEPQIDDWTSFGNKKDKKKKNSIWDEPEKEEENSATKDAFAADTADTGWGVFGTKKDKGKKGKKDPLEDIPPPPPAPEPVVEETPGLSRTGSTKGKKGKKGLISEVKEDPVTAVDSKAATDAATSVAADDDWMSGWGGTDKKKDKKNKRNSLASSKGDDAPAPPPPVPAVPEVPDTSFDIWGSSAKKDKDKKGKKGKISEPEPEFKPEVDLLALDDPIETKEDPPEDDWAASTWGLSAKDKKKKEKEREKAKREKEEKAKQEAEEKERLEREEQERQEEEERIAKEKEEEEKAAKAKEKTTAKGRAGKKGKTTGTPEPSKTKDLLADSVPDTAPIVEEDTWGSWGTSKKDKKKIGKKDMECDLPPPAPTPPAQGLTPEPEEENKDDEWSSFAPAKTTKGKKDAKKGAKDKIDEAAAKEETPAKAVKSFWGGMTATSASKSKTSKADEKAKKELEAEVEDEAKFDDELDADEIVEILDEPPKKSAKDKTGTKLSKTTTKDSDKTNKSTDAKKGVPDDDALTKGKKGKSKGVTKDTKDTKDDDNPEEDAFASIWGSSKKTSGKKGDEAKNKIGKGDSANQRASVNFGAWNEPEATTTEVDDQPVVEQLSKASKPAMSTTKTSKKSSVLDKVRELEKNKAQEPTVPPPPPVDPEPAPKTDKKGASKKTKDLASNQTTPGKKKGLFADPVEEKKDSKDSVPGSFPGAFEDMDDDFDNLLDSPPVEKQASKESKKSSKSTTKESKSSTKTRETPESKRPPTPPPEPKEEKPVEKPVKKERARVAKTGGAASWGMWGASAPTKDKKAAKSKDDADVVPAKKTAPTGLSRSKSTRTSKEKDKETVKSDPKSSDSEKPKKTESRPPKSRGSSFGGLFGAAPPSRTKSVRRNSAATSGPKVSSRRASMDVDATGLPSPPAEDAPPVSGKAAKVMGVSGSKLDRKSSTKGKAKAPAAPDPYPIDSDDMVMVNGIEDPVISSLNPKKGKDKGSKDLPDRTRSKRESKVESSKSKRQSKAFNEDEDVVMVDGGLSDGPDIADGPDDMQFITKPKGLQRSATSSKKPESKIGGLFGAFRKSRPAGDVKSKAVVEDDVTPRKRTVAGGDDSSKRPRRDDRRRSEKVSYRAAEGYVYNTEPDAAGATEAEDADARREERRAKRADKDRAAKEEALKYEADRRAKRRVAEKTKLSDEKDRKARKAADSEAKAHEEKEARRAARKAKEEEQANRDLEDDILKPRTNGERSSRPTKSDRRRSHYDKPQPIDDENEARRARRTKSDRRKSTAPVDDYFDPRNSKRNDPYGGGGGNDHTASWVESLSKESPEPPPVEPTIMEPAPDLRPSAAGADDLAADEDIRRSSHRKSKRSSRMYGAAIDGADFDDDRERRQRRRESKRGGEGSAEEERYRSPPSRGKSEMGGVKLGAGAKVFDGKTGAGKRSSWFQKIGGRM
ncbi:hypothetical protein ACLMJK_004036 [Lecanora helva]